MAVEDLEDLRMGDGGEAAVGEDGADGFAVGAGAESMSRGPYLISSQRWGSRLGNSEVLDYMLGILHDPFENLHMGITAENVAARHGITREMQDELAMRSQQRAAHAILEGRFKSCLLYTSAPHGERAARW